LEIVLSRRAIPAGKGVPGLLQQAGEDGRRAQGVLEQRIKID